MQTKSRIRGKQTTKTFVYMWIGARHMLKLAKTSEDGQLYTCISVLTFSAFMIEAYLNHLGALKHRDWNEIERKFGKLRKYTDFAQQADLRFDLNMRPYSSMVRLFAFRDQMAHGRTTKEDLDLEFVVGESLAASLPTAEWQQFASPDNAEFLLQDGVAIIRELHSASGYIDDPFGTGGGGMYAVSSAGA